jgi:membrane associated rhomboid family serine protease
MTNYDFRQPVNPLEEAKRFFSRGSALSVLILANVAVWALVQVLKVILYFFNYNPDHAAGSLVMHALALPAAIPLLAERPWTILSYMFLHIEFWHLLFNMLWLFWFGKIFLEFLPSRKLVLVYFTGGIAGGLLYVLAFNSFPVFARMLPLSFALGASASVMAIVTAASFYVPAYAIQLIFIGRIRIVYLAIILFVFDFFMIPTGNPGGHLAHIGGALFGFIYAQYLRSSGKPVPGKSRFSFSSLSNLFRKKSSHAAGQDRSERPLSDEEYNLRKKEKQQKIDEILEKISKGGYESLTREEKEFLFRSSGKR